MLKDIDILFDKRKFRNLSRSRLERVAMEAWGKSSELAIGQNYEGATYRTKPVF